ncbi:MAG: hypothetical protein AVDCRST_MAG87-3297 [uncultured Thermomicrobiales bacterium]|uniref:N-acetyltransferase domain-containing protein n=1 Tax=uncultured Thermomicrobiales bacterium TaxID=1645740 RepID=A0A6J4VIZ7_9BACT|nr:MAG: hypothetical protein AVDCRST_MAG87-3297 [uncultured Thermomicrobiales bacterium]
MHDRRQRTAPFLTGSRLGLRHPVLADARSATSWHEGAFPISETQAEELLRSTEIHPWGSAPETRLIVDSVPDGVTLGGAMVERRHDRIGRIRPSAASWLPVAERDEIHAEILALLLPWMLGELDLMVVTIQVPADHAATTMRAISLGMRESVRLREHIRRPDDRVDLLTFEIVNPAWNHAVRDPMEHADA